MDTKKLLSQALEWQRLARESTVTEVAEQCNRHQEWLMDAIQAERAAWHKNNIAKIFS